MISLAQIAVNKVSASLIVFPDELFFSLSLALAVFVKSSLKESALSETSVLYFYLWNSVMFYSEILVSP